MTVTKHLIGIGTALLVTASVGHAAYAEPLRIAYGIWVGNGPFFVAREMGFFSDEGVEIAMIHIDDHITALAEVTAGHADAFVSTLDTSVAQLEPEEEPLVCAFAMDESLGGDGVIATKDITSVAGLKGKMVAFGERSTAHFYLSVLLQQAGLTAADIAVVNLTGQDAAEAFMLQEVDAAVTWEPFLTRGKNSDHGHLLTDSSEQPGLLVDCVITTSSVFNERLSDFRALGRAWDAALDYVEAHADEANEIMARNVGGWLEDPEVFAETLKGIRFYDSKRNQEYFGTPAEPGQIYNTAQKAIDVWTSIGLLKIDVTAADVVAHGVWDD
jgi:NitT/TauT family transport system substrate-binding protein